MNSLIVFASSAALIGLTAWFKLKPKPAAAPQKIISDYGSFIERHGPTPLRIEDVSVLPYPKDVILSALLNAVVPRNDRRNEHLKTSAIFLAQFQPGVGSEPLHKSGFDLTAQFAQPLPTDPEAIVARAREIATNRQRFEEQAKRYEVFSALVERDLELMMDRFDIAAKAT